VGRSDETLETVLQVLVGCCRSHVVEVAESGRAVEPAVVHQTYDSASAEDPGRALVVEVELAARVPVCLAAVGGTVSCLDAHTKPCRFDPSAAI